MVVVMRYGVMLVRVGMGLVCSGCMVVGVVIIIMAVPMVMEGGGMGVVMAVLLVYQVNCAANH